MVYYLLQDFAAGLDLRKSEVTARAGSLRQLTNAFVNAGGEIEQRFKTTKVGTITSSDTEGLAFHNNALYTFGVAAPGDVSGLPLLVAYKQLVLDTPGPTISKILSAESFGDDLYVVARMSDDSVAHFLDGVQVTDNSVTGSYARAYQKSMYVVDEKNLWRSAIGDASVYDPTNVGKPGAVILDMQQEDGTGGDLMSVVPYYSFLAVMGRTSIQIWAMDPDPDLFQQIQTLGATGLIAHRAAARYANGDVLYLSDTGVRSIRARDSSNAAVLNDVGSPIDALITDKRVVDFTGAEDPIFALSDPLSGQWWLVWGSDVFALGYYPASKVSAWSRYTLPFSVDYVARAATRIFFRAGDDIYIYGALSSGGDPLDPSGSYPPKADWYDDTQVVIQTPFLDAENPAGRKRWQGLDMACQGVWDVSVCTDLSNPTNFKPVGKINRTTYGRGEIKISQVSTHMAVRLTSQTPQCRFAALGLHYKLGDTR